PRARNGWRWRPSSSTTPVPPNSSIGRSLGVFVRSSKKSLEPRRCETPQAEAVGNDRHRRERHRRGGDHRVEIAESGQGNGGDVVAERPEQVLADDLK